MRKRTLLVLLVVAGLGVGGFAALDYATRQEAMPNLVNFHGIRSNMSLSEVEELLGPDYKEENSPWHRERHARDSHEYIWSSGRLNIFV